MTATTKFLAGAAFNLLGRGRVYVADEDDDYLREGLFDDDPAVPYRAAQIRQDGWVKADLNLVQKSDGTDAGTFESFTGNLPDGWSESSSGGGLISAETTDVHGGLKALKCAAPSNGSAGAAINMTVRSGESLQLDLWMKSKDGGVARVRIFNQQTGHYLTAKSQWQSAAADCQTESSTSAYVNHKQTFTVEDYDTCQADTVTLTLRVYNSTPSAIALFDDVALYPGVNFFGFFAHNFEPLLTVLWQYSNNDAVGDSPSPYIAISSHAPRQPSFYGVTDTIYRRWIQFTLSGTPYADAASIGELVLGQTQTLTTDARHPAVADWQWGFFRPQVRNRRLDGGERPFNLNDHPQRTLRLPYQQTSDASFGQFRQEITRRCQDGAEPIVIVPDDSKPDVIFGRIPGEWSDRQGSLLSVHATELVVTESPFGLSGL